MGVAQPSRPTSRHGFEIAVICALTLEADAVEALFDLYWDDNGPPFDKAPGDPNTYSTGAIGRHNVVLAHMPGIGKGSAAVVASNCRMSFPNIRLALVVGICGVVPFGSSNNEIVLGDVVVSDGVIQYDFGRRLPDRFERKDTLLDSLGRPNLEIRGLLAKLKGLRSRKQLCRAITKYLSELQLEPLLAATYPGTINDRLFESIYRHISDEKTCEQIGCNGSLVQRKRLQTSQEGPQPAVHFGRIASGDSVIKSGEDRNTIAAKEGVIAFEMESAGIWDIFPCIVIKGACDYADSHKNKLWQHYAAATAAACMKAFLRYWVPSSPSLTHVSHTEISTQSCLASDPKLLDSEEAAKHKTGTVQPVVLWNLGDHKNVKSRDHLAKSEHTGVVDVPVGNHSVDSGDLLLWETQQVGRSLYQQKQYGAAEQRYRQAADGRERVLGLDHEDTLMSIHWLGRSLYRQGMYDAAERESRRAVDGRERILGIDHKDTLDSIYWLGSSLYEQKKYNEAERESRRAADGRERLLGLGHEDTLMSIQCIGSSLYEQKKYDAAEQEYRRAADGRERLLGLHHEDTLMSIYWLGRSLYEQKKYDAAEQGYRRAADGRERILGKDHKDTLVSIVWLGTSLYKQKKYNAAEREYRRAADDQERVLGLDHEDTLMSIHWLGRSLYRQGMYDAAERESRRAVDGRERILGIDHKDTLDSIYWLGSSLYKQKNYDAAERESRRAADGRERVLGLDHEDTLVSIHCIGRLLYEQKKYDEAEKEYRRAADGRERLLGKEHKDTLMSIHWLGRLSRVSREKSRIRQPEK